MEKKKTIIHLSTMALWDISKGKGRVSTILPLKGAVSAGYNVIYFTSSPIQAEGLEEGIVIKKINASFFTGRPLKLLLFQPIIPLIFFFSILKQTRYNNIKMICCHASALALTGFIISKILKVKYMLKLYGVTDVTCKKLHPSRILLRMAFKIPADIYLLTNDGTDAKNIAISYGVPENRISFLRNGIDKDINLYYDCELRKTITQTDEYLLVSLSRLANWKQVDLIIKAMPGIIKRISAKLLIFGDGDQREYLEKLACELGVEDNVVFLGAKKQSEVYRYLQISDLFISMNSASSMSNPVFESMLCAIPVLALNKGTTKDLITDGVNGYIIEEKDLDNMPLRVEAILRDDMNRTKIGQNARKYILDNFQTWDERVATEIDILNSLIDE